MRYELVSTWQHPWLLSLVEACRSSDHEITCACCLGDHVAIDQFGKPVVAMPLPEMLNRAVINWVSGKEHFVVLCVDNRSHLKVWGSDRLIIDNEASCATSISRRDDFGRANTHRGAGYEFNPMIIFVTPDCFC
jgi:hypothetical protein